MPNASSRAAAPTRSVSATSVPLATSAAPAAKARRRARSAVASAPTRPTAKSTSAPVVARKPVRLKLVRDSFTMPKTDFELIETLKQRALKLGHEVKKSELLRAGLHALAGQAGAALMASIQAVPRLKTGRPHKKAK